MYNFKEIEKKWQKYWIENNSFEPKNDFSMPKKYVLSMFPYPSGQLHMGHVRNYTIGDAIARYYRKNNFNVLHPFGWDAFGLPAENAAIKNNIHPKKWTYENIETMNKVIKELGISFSWNRELATCDNDYTKWEQYIFIKFLENNLIYRKKSLLNFCEQDNTVLANEQVIDNKCWRCDNEIQKKEFETYYLKITKYANELLADLKLLENKWPNEVLKMQKNWIGKKKFFKTQFSFNGKTYDLYFENFSELKSAKYLALSSKHDLVLDLIKEAKLNESVLEQINLIDKAYNNKDFSKKYLINLNLKANLPNQNLNLDLVVVDFLSNNSNVDSQLFNLENEKHKSYFDLFNLDKSLANNSFDENNFTKEVKFNLKDWGISRQRYWGTPIPIVKCQKCGIVPEKLENLPVLLPDDVVFNASGNPLESNQKWIQTKCPNCNLDAQRETDTLDTFFESSWYFLRYTTPKDLRWNQIFNQAQLKYWNSVDEYIGGIEHAILHLLYARFFTKALADLKLIDFKEPFSSLLTQGMVLKDGFKMSKSKGNVVAPTDMIEKYGADATRLFILFATTPSKELEWSDLGLIGCFKFLTRLTDKVKFINKSGKFEVHENLTKEQKLARYKLYLSLVKNKEIFEVKENEYAFNTLISWSMETLNEYSNEEDSNLITEMFYVLTYVLEPFIPHLAWDISQKYFNLKNFKNQKIDLAALELNTMSIGITINGKLRGELQVQKNITKENIFLLAREKVAKWLENKEVIKEIYIPSKLINFVIK